VAVEVASTAAVEADFMVVAEQRFTAEGVLAAEPTLRTLVDDLMPVIVAATMEGAATTVVAAVMAGATGGVAGIGAEDTVMDGAGELALGGRIGVGDGDIRMATTAPGITRRALIILTRITVLQTILRTIRILTTGTTILHRRIPIDGPCPTRMDRHDPGDHLYREAERIQTTQTTTPQRLRRVGRFSLLTG